MLLFVCHSPPPCCRADKKEKDGKAAKESAKTSSKTKEAAAAAPPSKASSAAPAKDAKDSKSSKKASKEKEEAAPKEKKSSSKKAEVAAAPAPPAKPAAPTSGDAVAASPPMDFPLAADKAVRLTYTITGVTALPPPPAVEAAAEGAPPAPSTPSASAVITLKVEPRSSKKAIDWVDVTVTPASPTGLLPPAASSTTRVVTGVKEKTKGKDRSKAGPLSVSIALPDGTSAVDLPVTIKYQVAGAAAPVTLAGVLRLCAASQLMPTVIDAEAYRQLMTTAGGGFITSVGAIPLPAGADAPSTIGAVVSVLRAYAVARSGEHAILYARTAAGANVTALLKVAADRATITFTVKSEVAGHAAVLTDDVLKALAAAAAAAAGGKADDAE